MARRSEYASLRVSDVAGPAVLWALSLAVAVIAAATPAPGPSRGASSAQEAVVLASRR
jgi:hypothetical protein